jgi:hypothetical protein
VLADVPLYFSAILALMAALLLAGVIAAVVARRRPAVPH